MEQIIQNNTYKTLINQIDEKINKKTKKIRRQTIIR